MSNSDWLKLALAPSLQSASVAKLLNDYGSATEICTASAAILRAAGLSKLCIAAIQSPDQQQMATTLEWLAADNHHLIHWQNDHYPELLRNTDQGPTCLFVSGDPELLGLPQIAIVGSRNATPAGLEIAQHFAAHLASCGLLVTSGLALGIDAAAHSGAIDGGGLTLAVLGTGPDIVYPQANAPLAARIEHYGALVSEFAPGTAVRRHRFPQRNRIIAGLSLGTLVVEAGVQSGSLITARLAAEFGREVFAIPGSIHNPVSKGCHRLIRQGAKLVEQAADIIEEIGEIVTSMIQLSQSEIEKPSVPETLSAIDPEHAKLLHYISYDPVSIDTLIRRSGLTAEELSSMLLILELQGRVQALSGGRFQQKTLRRQPHE